MPSIRDPLQWWLCFGTQWKWYSRNSSEQFGLTISLSKTGALHQPYANTGLYGPPIFIGYLNLQICRKHNLKWWPTEHKIKSRINPDSQALGRLQLRVLDQYNMQIKMKLRFYQAVAIMTLVCGFHAWMPTPKHIKHLGNSISGT